MIEYCIVGSVCFIFGMLAMFLIELTFRKSCTLEELAREERKK